MVKDPAKAPAMDLLGAVLMNGVPCTFGRCANTKHDHSQDDDLGKTVPMVCGDCGQPSHYDYTVESYRHDDPEAPSCWMSRNVWGAPLPRSTDHALLLNGEAVSVCCGAFVTFHDSDLCCKTCWALV